MASKKKPPAREPAPRKPLPRASPLGVLERLRKLCLSMPAAIEKESHGEPTWFAGEKGRVFAMFDNHHHGAPHVSVWLPTPKELQETLVASDRAKYFVPPYVGPKGWVGVVLDANPDWKVVEELIREAFDSVTIASQRRTVPGPSKARTKRAKR
jgi:predicted DNA-binding protein (MmcQ/YjbR family)